MVGTEFIFIGGAALFLMLLLGYFAVSFYQTCKPNQAMIISGFGTGEDGRAFKIVVGGGTVAFPMVQMVSRLSLEIMTIEIVPSAPMTTRDGIPLNIKAIAQCKVKGDSVSIATAAEQFLGKSDVEISTLVHETLVGHLRAVIGQLTVEELISNFDMFAQRVQEICISDLAKMGITIVSLTVAEISDNVGYLESLAQKRTAEAKRDADIFKAAKEKEALLATFQTEIEMKLIKELDVDSLQRISNINEYERALPLLENALGAKSIVLRDFVLRYAQVLAAGKDMLSCGKAEELMKRAESIKSSAAAV